MKNNKGFTQIDIAISLIILMLFVSLIATLFINSNNATNEAKREAECKIYLTQILQTIDYIDYDKLEDNTDGIVPKVNSLDSTKLSAVLGTNDFSAETYSTPYVAHINVENYNTTTGNTDKDDLVKIITINISYKNNKNSPIQAQRLKTRDIKYRDSLEISPNLLQGMEPISNDDNSQITTQYASNWFDYSNKKVAEVTLADRIVSSLETGKISDNPQEKGSRFIFVPRFAYCVENGTTKIKFLNEDNTCKDGSSTSIYKETENTENGKYYIPNIFTKNNIELEGIWVGKYLVREKTDTTNGNESSIYIYNDGTIWTSLANSEIETQINNMTTNENVYGLDTNTDINLVDTNVSSAIQKLYNSGENQYRFIADAINQDSETAGAFRIYIY